MSNLKKRDLVVLVSGFLGFEVIGWHSGKSTPGQPFRYFHRSIEGILQKELGENFVVEQVSPAPTASLRRRQQDLIEELEAHLLTHDSIDRLYLVGHSTGAVDARLLLAGRDLFDQPWSEGAQKVREKIRRVIGIAPAHHGTWLANCKEARLLVEQSEESVFESLRQIRSAFSLRKLRALHSILWSNVWVVPGIFSALLWDPDARRLFGAGRTDLPGVARLIQSIWKDHSLIVDLHPATMSGIGFQDVEHGAALHSIVTMAGADRGADVATGPGPLFRWLSNRTGRVGEDLSPAQQAQVDKGQAGISRSVARLNAALEDPKAAGVTLIANLDEARPPSVVDEATNDAVLNSARQLFDPEDDSELLAIVIADHADVIGHYDRQQGHDREGFIKSGSGYRDAQADALWRLVARKICGSPE